MILLKYGKRDGYFKIFCYRSLMYIPIFLHEGDGDPGVIPYFCSHYFPSARVDLIHRTKGEKPRVKELSSWRMAVFMGGHESLTEIQNYPYLLEEVNYIQELSRLQKPVLGICLGGQLLSHSFGGQVTRSPKGEFGLWPISVKSPLHGIEEHFFTYHWHSDIFSASADRTLMHSDHSSHQLVQWAPRIWGTQFHPEITRDSFPLWSRDLLIHQQENPHQFYGLSNEVLFEQYRAENDLFLHAFFRHGE